MQGDDCNRRKFLVAMTGAIAGFTALTKICFAERGTPLKVVQSAGTEPPTLEVPANATDCHHHIYDARYPFASGTSVRPPEARASDYCMLQRRLGISRNVIVQPTAYGEDNSLVLASLRAFGAKNTRAIVVVPPTISDAELKQMHQAGVRGMRFDFLNPDTGPTWEMMESMAKRFAPLGWHAQIYAKGADTFAHKDLLNHLACPIVFDHLARAHDAGDLKDELIAMVCDLMKQGKAWTKIALDVSKVGPPTYADTVAVATEYVKQAPGRLVWGSNWPHPGSPVQNKPDDAFIFDLLSRVAPDAEIRKRILVDNAAELYGF